MFTVDASVHVSALNPAEDGSGDSQALLERLHGRPWLVFSPTLLLVEVSAAAARALGDAGQALALSHALRGLPGQIWVPLDDYLAGEAAQLAAERRLRGADAVYAAVARRYGSVLITLDRQQLERLGAAVEALTPAEALERLNAGDGQP